MHSQLIEAYACEVIQLQFPTFYYQLNYFFDGFNTAMRWTSLKVCYYISVCNPSITHNKNTSKWVKVAQTYAKRYAVSTNTKINYKQ